MIISLIKYCDITRGRDILIALLERMIRYFKYADILRIFKTRSIRMYTRPDVWQIVQRSNADRTGLLIKASCLPRTIFNDVVNDCY